MKAIWQGVVLAHSDDTVVVDLEVEDATATDTRIGLVERGEASAARALPRPWFVQLKGIARISGRANVILEKCHAGA